MAAPLTRTFHKQFRRKYATCYGLNYDFGQVHMAFAIKNLRNNQNFCLQLLIQNKLLKRLNQTNVVINVIAATPPVTFFEIVSTFARNTRQSTRSQ